MAEVVSETAKHSRYLTELLAQVRKYSPSADENLLAAAYSFSKAAHEGQFRLSGEPFFSHCVEVARILAELELDTVTIAAGLLHDVVEDTGCEIGAVEERFGHEVAMLVAGVTKISMLGFKTDEEHAAENLRKMLVAMAEDIRVILIKLADRMHNMRTLQYLPPEKIERISRDTLEIYAPLAHRLGIAKVRWELEDLAFRYLKPREYKELASRIARKRRERENSAQDACTHIKTFLKGAEIDAEVMGRPKHLYSVYHKMVEQGRDFDQIFDLLAVRVLTKNLADCYAAMGIIHSHWKPLPGKVKDYIAMPKANMYQSLHTIVVRDTGETLEIQIRTLDMHRTAEEGIAAHWRYKQGPRKVDEQLDQKLLWFRQMIEWLQDAKDPKEFMESLKIDLFANEVYVFTPKGHVRVLPRGSTPVDFAYAIHTEIGDHCLGARVNGKMVPLRYNLQQGDRVEILTSKTQVPHRDWLEFVKTPKARYRIRHSLRARGELEEVEEGAGRPAEPVPPARAERRREVRRGVHGREHRIRIEGQKGLQVHFAKCCDPMPGEQVVGYVTRGRVSVHRADCPHFLQACRDEARIVPAQWEGETRIIETAGIRITAIDRPNLLSDILQSFVPLTVNISQARAYKARNHRGMIDLVFELTEEGQLDKVIATVNQVSGVTGISRLKPTEYR